MTRSLTRHTSLAAMLVAALIIGAALVNQYLLVVQNREHAEAESQVNFRSYHYAVVNQVRFYRRLVTRLARRPDVQDLLAFADSQQAFLWASEYRKLLPDAIGLALVRADGKVLGKPVSLFLGPACVRDIEHLVENDFTGVASVHRDNPELEHFDLMAPVNDVEGQLLGYLFVSFSLEVLQDFAANILRQGHRLTLHDEHGQLIVAVNGLSGAESPMRLSGTLPDTRWTLTLESHALDLGASLAVLNTTAVLLAVLVAGAIILLVRSVSKRVLGELRGIQCALSAIAEDQAGEPRIAAGFLETKAMVDAIGEISNRIQKQKRALACLGDTDELTGLLNRRRFRSELDDIWQMSLQGHQVCLLYIDVDGFKQVNDRFGHHTGDEVLIALGACIKDCLRQGDVAARLGGDEFVVLIADNDADRCASLFERISDSFTARQRGMVGDSEPCSLSAGLVNLDPVMDSGPGGALKRADAALYRAKRSGKNRVCVDGLADPQNALTPAARPG